ncbi:hypothetical protein IAR50_001029 [Cryptococcus sp. DSM 104548]
MSQALDDDFSWAEVNEDLTAAPVSEYAGSQPNEEAASKPNTTVPQSLAQDDTTRTDLQDLVDAEGGGNSSR